MGGVPGPGHPVTPDQLMQDRLTQVVNGDSLSNNDLKQSPGHNHNNSNAPGTPRNDGTLPPVSHTDMQNMQSFNLSYPDTAMDHGTVVCHGTREYTRCGFGMTSYVVVWFLGAMWRNRRNIKNQTDDWWGSEALRKASCASRRWRWSASTTTTTTSRILFPSTNAIAAAHCSDIRSLPYSRPTHRRHEHGTPRATRNASEWNTWSDDASKCCVWLQQWPLSTREWWLRNFRSGGRLPQTQLTLHTLLLYLDCTIRHTRVRLYRTNIYIVHTAKFMFACSNVVSHCSYYRYYLFFFVSLHFRATNLFTFCTWTIRNLYSVILLFFGKRCSFTCTLLSCIKRKYC